MTIPRGIQVSRGVTLQIPVGGLVVHQGVGRPNRMELRAVELQLDTCVYWLEIAFEQLVGAEHERKLIEDHSLANAESEFDLDREFKCCVQATVAAATFFEALHAAMSERDPSRQPRSRVNNGRRTARSAVVTEQLRRSFGLRKQGTANLRSVVGEVYRFRDAAVHPTSKFSQPLQHSYFPIMVERRFAMFTFEHSKMIVRAAIAFSKILPSRDLSRRPRAIQTFGAYLLQVCAPLHAAWEDRYGALLEPPAAT